MKVNQTSDLKELLEHHYQHFHAKSFIPSDPISIPHMFKKKEDIEIAGFLTAIISWGQRKSILNNASKMMELMDHAPADFIFNHQEKDLKRFQNFGHRTFMPIDAQFFIHRLQDIYLKHGNLESAICNKPDIGESLHHFKNLFFNGTELKRTQKHLADPIKGSSAKRLNMFLRWMVRSGEKGVDFGLWKSIKPSQLMMPLDVHSANVSRKLGLLQRKQNDWKAVEELTNNLREFDKSDPVKYDFALFGIGVNQLI